MFLSRMLPGRLATRLVSKDLTELALNQRTDVILSAMCPSSLFALDFLTNV